MRTVVAKLSRSLYTSGGSGLTPTGLSVLLTVARRGPLRLAELAEIEGLNPTMLSRVVAGLAEKGLVQRLQDPADRRAAVLEVTGDGKRLRRRIQRERAAVLDAQLDRLDVADREQLLNALPALERLAACMTREPEAVTREVQR
ncbi:MarR family winged helix-turn-helix transcriptional regulator [Conexibacter sp. CPCC 206217]|uniref:MarR family winged helix-turn-helix transcriptional regulator n=1 Tax=Conexibacter sp. CPCC 206217 TaxID=3064574 RepID=UPI002726C09D|nr:MarR family transcriptional regulator [Conexibacter sp. CPCC 206217]MDO8210635.1 MarR family transcriptional regulator [Conexibacter sp. CPCC 206217]